MWFGTWCRKPSDSDLLISLHPYRTQGLRTPCKHTTLFTSHTVFTPLHSLHSSSSLLFNCPPFTYQPWRNIAASNFFPLLVKSVPSEESCINAVYLFLSLVLVLNVSFTESGQCSVFACSRLEVHSGVIRQDGQWLAGWWQTPKTRLLSVYESLSPLTNIYHK